jgi:hypothetical protein
LFFFVGSDAAGSPIVAGELGADLTFCDHTVVSAGDDDVVVARLAW